MSPRDKPLFVLHGAITTPPLSAEARQEVGYLLRLLQQGEKLSLPQSRPMPSAIGAGCHELRVNDPETRKTWRVVYWLDTDAVYVLDVFAKKTQTTPADVKRRCQQRLKQLQRDLRETDDE